MDVCTEGSAVGVVVREIATGVGMLSFENVWPVDNTRGESPLGRVTNQNGRVTNVEFSVGLGIEDVEEPLSSSLCEPEVMPSEIEEIDVTFFVKKGIPLAVVILAINKFHRFMIGGTVVDVGMSEAVGEIDVTIAEFVEDEGTVSGEVVDTAIVDEEKEGSVAEREVVEEGGNSSNVTDSWETGNELTGYVEMLGVLISVVKVGEEESESFDGPLEPKGGLSDEVLFHTPVELAIML